MTQKAISICIRGKVQNVGFRYHAKKAAQKFGLKGFIRNEFDGSVYAEVEGETLAVERFYEWCKKGPSWGRVDTTIFCEIPPRNFTDFTITR